MRTAEITEADAAPVVGYAAGFADAAHLSRTSVRTFGFAPSALQVIAAPPQLQHTISE